MKDFNFEDLNNFIRNEIGKLSILDPRQKHLKLLQSKLINFK